MSKINKRKYINKVKERLPDSWQPKFESFFDFLKHVVYQRWYKIRFIGFFHFVQYLVKNKIKVATAVKEKRILGINDFKVTDVAIGNMLEFQVRLLCEAYINKVDKIDIALVYDPVNPVGHWKYTSWMNKDNFHYHLAELFPLLNLSPKLGSVFIFNSKDDLELFLDQNRSRYFTCPSIFKYANNLGFARDNYRFLRSFYDKEKFLPQLELPKIVNLWTKAFVKKNLKGKYMIAVNLRTNPFFAQQRNAIMASWKDFFEYCLKKHDNVVFVILGRKSDVIEAFKELPNVIFTPEHNINIQHTLSFIKHSLFYMATSSGPASFAILSEDIAYLIVSFHAPDISFNYNWWKPGTHLPWQNKELQKLIWEQETPQILIKEFEDLFNIVAKEKWRKELDLENIDESILEWPYLIKGT